MHRYFHRFLLLLVALCSFGFGQVAYQLAPVAHQQFFDANGKPLAGGFVYTYSAGSTTPLATYKDNAGTANTNPIVLDAGGFATIYLGQNSYKFVVQNSSAVQQWSQDNVQNISQVLLTTANVWTFGQTFNSLISFLGGTSDTTAAEGNVFYRTDLHRLRVYDGTAWRSVVGVDSTDTLTNKSLTSPTISGTDNGFETLTNKTLTAPNITGMTTTTGQIVSTLATGTAPLSITSTTTVPNLTASNHPTVFACGVTSTCGNTAQLSARIFFGQAPLVSASPSTVTITGFTPAFSSTTSFQCSVSNMTTQANPVKVVNTSASSITITGPNTVTDVVSFVCSGT